MCRHPKINVIGTLKLQSLSILHFKNIREANLVFADKINCFVGLNGQGKTNLLDAIYHLSFTKSFLNNLDSQNITHGADVVAVAAIGGPAVHARGDAAKLQRAHVAAVELQIGELRQGLLPGQVARPVRADEAPRRRRGVGVLRGEGAAAA